MEPQRRPEVQLTNPALSAVRDFLRVTRDAADKVLVGGAIVAPFIGVALGFGVFAEAKGIDVPILPHYQYLGDVIKDVVINGGAGLAGLFGIRGVATIGVNVIETHGAKK